MTREVIRAVRYVLAMTGAAALTTLSGGPAAAQTPTAKSADDTPALETVIVTGSHIRRTDSETASPVQVLSAEQIQESGFTSTQQVLNNLTANGQGTLSQSFSGAFAAGGAGIALRGLTVGYTLVLIDGHRMAPYPIGDDGQRSFVDISNIPFDSIERVEVVKDGASAVYGSDAIAGVVNVILKRSFQGASATADVGSSAHGDGNTYHVSATWGLGDLVNDGRNFYISGEFRKEQQIRFADRGGIFTNLDYSGTGGINSTFGAPNVINGDKPASVTGYITSPKTGAIIGFMPGCDLTQLNAGQCTYKDTWDQIQPATENYNLVTKFTQALDSGWQLALQGTYFESKSDQAASPLSIRTGGYQGVAVGPDVPPTLLPSVGLPLIPRTNPSFPTGVDPAYDSAVVHYNLRDQIGSRLTRTDAKSYRAIAEVTGKVSSWDIDGSVGFTEVNLGEVATGRQNPSAVVAALNSATDPLLIGQNNSAAVLNEISPRLTTTDTSKLSLAHLGASTSLTALQGGSLGLAFGADYFNRQQHAQAPALVAAGVVPNFSNNFTIGIQQVASAYAEVDAPVLKQLDIDAAVRYDHYNLSGGRASPKIGFKFTPLPEFALRGTASQGFRAPGPGENGRAGQSFVAGSTADPILCKNPGTITAPGNFVGQCSIAVAQLQLSNPHLKPETSTAFTLGVIFEPFKDFSATLDLYSIKINNQIVIGGQTVTVRGDNLTPILEYQPDGTSALAVPPAAPIAYQTTSFINANSTKTDGFDLGYDYRYRFANGWQLRSQATWSFTHKYEIVIDGTTYELAGTHGPTVVSGDTGNPRSRVSWTNTVGKGPWSLTATLNYISAFSVIDPSAVAFIGPTQPQDTCIEALQNGLGAAVSTAYQNLITQGIVPNQSMCSVKHFTTLDLYGRYDVSEHLSLHASATNVFNTKAPLDWATYGGQGGLVPFNPSLHLQGAIGAFFSLGATYNF
jgi:iron complex outermembrane recepter protein